MPEQHSLATSADAALSSEYLTADEALGYLRLPQTRGGARLLLVASETGQLKVAKVGRSRIYRRRRLVERLP